MFGSTPFGQTNSPFGGFGNQPTTTGTFGTPTPNSTPFGQTSTFGSTAPSGTGFGGTSAFGSQPTASPFGGTASTFGTSTGFGTQQPAFGSTQPTSGTGFGGTSTFGSTPGFGQSTGSLFGQTNTGPSTGFGTSTSTGIFGQSTNTGSLFGQSTNPSPFGASTGVFGSTSQPSTFGGFGGTTPSTGGFGTGLGTQPATTGTGSPSYKPTPETDPTTGTTFQQTAITAMPAFQTKSFEELRWEDYQTKKQGGVWQAPTQTSAFQTTGSTFGSASTSLFGGGTTSTFGGAQPQTSSFGVSQPQTSTFGGFGMTQPSSAPAFGGGAFGSTLATPFSTTTPSPFGATTSSFGSTTAQSSIFGGTTPTTTPSIFGATSTPTFGAPASTTTPGFGFGTSTQPSTSGPSFSFGTPAVSTGLTGTTTGSLFGASTTTTTPGFGFGTGSTTTPAATGFGPGLGTTTPGTSGGFGMTPAAPFGSTTGTLFSTTAPSTITTPTTTPFSFGTTPTTNANLFGTTSNPSLTTPSLFGTSFGTTTGAGLTNFSTTPTTPFGANLGLSTGLGGTPTKTATINSQPYGIVPSLSPATPISGASVPTITPVSTKAKKTITPSHYKLTPRSAAKIRPRGVRTPKSSLFEDTQTLTPEVFVPRVDNIKKLIIEPDESEKKEGSVSNLQRTDLTSMSPSRTLLREYNVNRTENVASQSIEEKTTSIVPSPPLQEAKDQSPIKPTPLRGNAGKKTLLSAQNQGKAQAEELPKLTKSDYYTIPDLQKLHSMSSNDLAAIKDFTVGRTNFGQVKFHGFTDVRGLNLNEIIHFEHAEIIVYPEESFPQSRKPSVGEGLNKKAQIILEKVWPQDRATGEFKRDEASLKKYEQRLISSTLKLGAKFVSYEKDTGCWIFEVEHFSRYGIVDDSDEEEQQPQEVMSPHEMISQDQFIPPSPNRLAPMESEEEEEEELPNVPLDQDEGYYEEEDRYPSEEGHMEDEPSHYQDTQQAFTTSGAKLPQQLGLNPAKMQLMKSFMFDDEAELEREVKIPKKIESKYSPIAGIEVTSEMSELSPIALQPLHQLSLPIHKRPLKPKFEQPILILETKPSHCRIKLANSVISNKLHTHNDAGTFLGRSFRVGWAPNGTLIHSGNPLGRAKSTDFYSKIVIEKLYVAPGLDDTIQGQKQYLALLEPHLNCSTRSQSEVPSFNLGNAQENMKQTIMSLNILGDLALTKSVKRIIEESINIFELLYSLYGRDLSGDAVFKGFNKDSMYDDSFTEAVARRFAVSNWLKKVVSPILNAELKHTEDPVDKMFSYLTGKQIILATEQAFANRDFRLATLLSQASCNTGLTELMAGQIDIWDQIFEENPEKFISKNRQKLYKLLSGNFDSVVDGLDWKRCFGLFMWYAGDNEASISNALISYKQSVENKKSCPPVPSYLQPLSRRDYIKRKTQVAVDEYNTMYTWNSRDEIYCKPFEDDTGKWERITEAELLKKVIFCVIKVGKDTAYHLFKLYTDRSHYLWKVVAPSSFSPFALDHRVSWHIYSILCRLGYSEMDNVNSLFMSYVQQLEAAGLWHWAIYVLLHLPKDKTFNDFLQISAIKHLLAAHIHDMSLEKEEFLINKLHLPRVWLEETRAWKAAYERDTSAQVHHLVAAQQWRHAHHILINNLAPNLLMNGAVDDLSNILLQLEQHSRDITEWTNNGQIYFDFIKLGKEIRITLELIEQKRQEPNVQEWRRLQEYAIGLSTRIAGFIQKRNARKIADSQLALAESVCLSQISIEMAEFMKSITKMLATFVSNPLEMRQEGIQMASQFLPLSIPEDYRLTQVQELCAHYLDLETVKSVA